MASANNVEELSMIEVADQNCMDVDTLPDPSAEASHCSQVRSECDSTTGQAEDIERNELQGTYCGNPECVEAQEHQHGVEKDSLLRHIEEEELQKSTCTHVELKNEAVDVSNVAMKRKETPRTRTRCLSLGSCDPAIHAGFSTLSSLPGEISAVSLPCSSLDMSSSSQHAEEVVEEPEILPSDVPQTVATPDEASSSEAPSGTTESSSSLNDSGWGDRAPGWRRLSVAQTYGWKSSRRVCHHRLNLAQEGPPCYLCSMSDLPPKYHHREDVGLRKVKKRLMALFQGLATRGQRPRPPPAGSQGNPPFTISSERCNRHGGSQTPPSGTPNTLPPPDIDTGDYTRTQFDDNVPELRQSSSSSSPYRPHQRPSSDVSSSEATHTGDTPPHWNSGYSDHSGGPVEAVPPPYSPPTPGSLVSRDTHEVLQLHLRQEGDPTTSGDHCLYNKNLQYNIVYSFLLASATTITVMGYDQPVVILACVVIFLTVFIFMPLIWLAECLFRWKSGRFPRNFEFSQFQAPFVLPAIR